MIIAVEEGKRRLREDILRERRKMSDLTVNLYSAKVVQAILGWDIYLRSENVMLYTPMPDEPKIQSVFEHAWSKGKRVSVPHLTETFGIMEAALIQSFDDLVLGKFNLQIPNPRKLKIIDPMAIDLVIVPGVAFDKEGYRLGMGGGYYDRFLPKAIRAATLGICWSKYILNKVASEQHDFPVEYLVTEKGILNCKKGKM